MSKTLIIAEKYSVAKEIAHVVGATNKVVEAKDARYGYYEGDKYIVSWCYGHLLSLYYPEDYDEDLKVWRVQGLPFVPSVWKYNVVSTTKKQYSVLKRLLLSKDVSDVICATDADREGELIFRLVYNSTKSTKPVKRLWISSMEDASIKNGLKKMKSLEEYDNLFHAASARQKADWIVGLNATRYFTCRYSKYPEIVNIGRVQTPTVNLIVERQKEIDNFIPKAYYMLTADTGSFKAKLRKEDKASADSIIKKCNGKSGYIESINTEKKKSAPPSLYALTNLQQDADRMLGLSATETLNIVQSLYEKKILTYPRTDSQFLTSDMKESTEEIIYGFLNKDDFIVPSAKAILQTKAPNVNAVINDKKVSGHHAIIPTVTSLSENISSLKPKEQKIFYMVLYRLLAAVSIPHEYLFTKIILNVQDERFAATGKQTLVGGWHDIADCIKTVIGDTKNTDQDKDAKNDDEDENQSLPEVHEGDTFNKVKVSGQEKFTTPPSPYTEATLLKDMQNIGKKIEDKDLKAVMSRVDDNGNKKMLGTSATQGSIIDKIIKTGYVRKVGRKFEPTEKGYKLIELVPEAIKSPVMTAEWEQALEDIKEGKATEDAFVSKISSFTKNVISSSDKEYERLSKSSDKKVVISSSALGKCPKCGNDIVARAKTWSCENSACGFVIWKSVASKTLTETNVKDLLQKRKTSLIKGFKSKVGKSFDAYLILNDEWQVKFEFDNKK